MVRNVQNAVHGGVAHVDVGRSHIDLGAQRLCAVGELAVLHALEEIEVFLDRAVAPRTVLARFGQRAAVFAHLVLREVVDVRLAVLDELDRQLVALVEVGRAETQLIPFEAEPVNIFLDRLDVFDVLLGGVRVVEPQIAGAAVFLGDAEVHGQRLCVTDMQIAVRFGRKARFHAAVHCFQVFFDKFFNEVFAPFFHCGFLPVGDMLRTYFPILTIYYNAHFLFSQDAKRIFSKNPYRFDAPAQTNGAGRPAKI